MTGISDSMQDQLEAAYADQIPTLHRLLPGLTANAVLRTCRKLCMMQVSNACETCMPAVNESSLFRRPLTFILLPRYQHPCQVGLIRAAHI